MSANPPSAHHFETVLEWPHEATGTSAHPDAAYSRNSAVRATGKHEVSASAPTAFGGDAARYNPEELLLMSLSQCHMLTFLALASKKRLAVRRYADRAMGTLGLGEHGTPGKMSMQEVVLYPQVEVEGADAQTIADMHAKAHANCFMANSVNFPVRVSMGETMPSE